MIKFLSKHLKKKNLTGGYSEENALTMRAKINFFGTEVGEHQNILLFIGAVIDNNASKLVSNNFV